MVDYLAAKENYLAASSLKPSEALPKAKIAEIDKKMSAESNKEELYMSTLATADQFFGSKKYLEAKAKYEEANKIKPSEKYPQDRIAESEKAFVELKAKQEAEALLAEKDRNYNQEIEKGDKEFTAKNYKNAKTYYQNAIGYKSTEAYPKDQLLVIEKLIKEGDEALKREAELVLIKERYNAQIAKADAAFDSKNYSNAKIAYEEALKIKSDESYPTVQLAKIARLLEEIELTAQKKNELDRINKEYQSVIANADKAFYSKNYESAKDAYNQALSIKPSESHPKTRLDLIEKALADIAALAGKELKEQGLDKQYKALIDEADAAFKAKQYEPSRKAYSAALELKGNESYPKSQLKLIDDRVKEEKAEKEFEAIIALADADFKLEAYESSKETYKTALTLKPDHNYSKNQIAEIEKRLLALNTQANEEAKRIADQKKYVELIATADDFFNSAKYEESINSYSIAQNLNPIDDYPKGKIIDANKHIKELETEMTAASELQELNTKYNALISSADKLFDLESFEESITAYQNAQIVKPSETYPAERIKVIKKMLDEKALKEANAAETAQREADEIKRTKEYEDLISEADGYLNDEDFMNARTKYEKAKSLYPSKPYAPAQIKKIDDLVKDRNELLLAEKNKLTAYNEFIAKGDQSVINKDWASARLSFKSALELFPDELIPTARLKEIDALEEKQNRDAENEKFNQLVSAADQAFLVKDYEAALNSYNAALEIISDNGHCLARKAKVLELLNKKEEIAEEKKDATRRIEEENTEEGNAKVTIRKVYVGDKVEVYKRVIHSWGGKYYFLNDQPISELVWTRDTTN